jgi:DNA-binding CsgD family transcriptional regulator
MAVDEDVEKVKASFQKCLKGEPDFHIARLREGPLTEFPGQKLCAWLHPVKNPRGCPHSCVSVMCHCVIVPKEFEQLTRRERDVLAVLAQGKSPTDIAADMQLERTTVHTYLYRVREKLGLEHLMQVSAWAVVYRDILPLQDL